MDQRLRRGFRIGVFDVEPLSGIVSGPDGALHVQPKVMDVLVYLAEHAGELVERDTLLEQVWRRITSEEVLTRCISELRRALGDDRGKPRYIQTVPKRGYRLVEPVVLDREAAERAPQALDAAAPSDATPGAAPGAAPAP
ncbi:MAG TPA: transcriptional regulator, partial [Gammaproteobacteria bacterium]|nr:transcriptional regulator [Gammaproteobacteria bacterium]